MSLRKCVYVIRISIPTKSKRATSGRPWRPEGGGLPVPGKLALESPVCSVGSKPTRLSHFCLDKLHFLPEACQINQTHAHRMSPTREVMSHTPRSGLASQAAGERSDSGEATASGTHSTGKPQLPRAALGAKAKESRGARNALARRAWRGEEPGRSSSLKEPLTA